MQSLTGQQREYLKTAVYRGVLSHAYIVFGDEDTAYSLAIELAKILLCRGNGAPCGACVPCRKIEGGYHPDVHILKPPEGKNLISAEQIRDVCEMVNILPNEADKKIYIIRGGEKITVVGQNALLKVLEEPPAHAMFILTCGNDGALLPTVRSRCVKLRVDGEKIGLDKNIEDYECFIDGLRGNNNYVFSMQTAKWSAEKDRDKLINKLYGLKLFMEQFLSEGDGTLPQKQVIKVIESANKAAAEIAAGANKKMSILSFIIDCREAKN